MSLTVFAAYAALPSAKDDASMHQLVVNDRLGSIERLCAMGSGSLVIGSLCREMAHLSRAGHNVDDGLSSPTSIGSLHKPWNVIL